MEEEFWNVKPSDERPAETLKTFIIFCEDEHHEPLYFKSFEQAVPGIKINAIENLRSKKLNLNATIQISVDKGLINFDNGVYSLLPGVTDHLWCVYDRDMESEIWADIPPQNHVDFDTSIIAAQNAGLKVAWSNDVFEMWILLHFEPIPMGNILNRSYIYDRLTHIFKYVVPRNPDLDAVTSPDTFNYKANMKRRERFISQVIPLLHPRTADAIANAKILEAEFTANIAYHMRNPCTMVHHLVQEILLKP
jgi:hypothetical protein